MAALKYLLLAFSAINSLKAVERNEVTYYLFTAQSPQTYIEVDASNASSYVDKNHETIFLIHGWTENRQVQWYEELKNAYIKKTDKAYNIIEVDWSGPAKESYVKSAESTKVVGQYLGEFIVDLVESLHVSLEKIHVIGHSLGGQVAGFTGKTVIKLKNRKVGRITALDPAGPLFAGILVSELDRLNKFDAEVVVVIHTDGGIFYFGYLSPCGTVDIYPNGGSRFQPGCPWPPVGLNAFCGHHRSFKYFIDALENPHSLMASLCYSYSAYLWGKCAEGKSIDIGGEINQDDSGLYYLKTNSEKPYGK